MSTIGVGTKQGPKNTDYDAAQTLLDLQSNKYQEENAGTCIGDWRDMDSREDIEKAAKLILSCFISSEVQPTPVITNLCTNNNSTHFSTQKILLDTNQSYRRSGIIEAHRACHKSNMSFDKRISSNKLSSYIETDSETSNKTEMKRQFRDAETQTEEQYLNPSIQLMEITIKNLCDRIKTLEAQLQISPDPSVDETASFETAAEHSLDFSKDNNDQDPGSNMTVDDTDTVNNKSKYARTSEFDSSAFNDSRNSQTNKSVVYSGILKNHNKNSCDLVSIGDGKTTVPLRLLKQINWNSYSSATRKLLTAVFSRRILATHSLTGKPSPAFPNKPAKKRLNPTLVNDIVQTVVERCHVPENVVRTSITTKCADESKMFRTREKNKKKRLNKNNRENVSPTSDSESEDY